VVFFLLFFRHHPLEGKAFVNQPCITEVKELELLGTHPVFVFDPADASNRPVPGIHKNPLRLWPQFPGYFREAFVQSFGPGLHDASARLSENQWLKLLIRLRDDVVTCGSCGLTLPAEGFGSFGGMACPGCHADLTGILKLDAGRYSIFLCPGKAVFACHAGSSDDYTTIIAKVEKAGIRALFSKNRDALAIKNLSGEPWLLTTADRQVRSIENNTCAAAEEGTVLVFGNGTNGVISAVNSFGG
jgi:hypothetical protein